MGFFGKLFGKGEHKNESQKDSVIKLNVNKKSSTFVAEIATKPDSELSHKGPQVFVIMNSKKDSRAVAMNLPQAVKNMLASKAQIIDLKNNSSAIHLCFDDNVNIRKSIDRLFNSNYGADLGDYGLTSLNVGMFLTVDSPGDDLKYLLRTYSSTGQAINVGRVLYWA